MRLGRKRRRLVNGRGAVAVTLVALLCAAGCGGGGSNSASTAAGTGGNAPPPAVRRPSAPTAPKPLPNQGTKAPAPGVPTAAGGNPIQAFGVEASAAERVAAAALAQAVLRAEAQGRWSPVCARLAAPLRRKLLLLAAHFRAAGKGAGACAADLALLHSRARRAAPPDPRIRVLSMRVRGAQGFLLYRGGGGFYDLPLRREGGGWLVASLRGFPLAP